MNLSYNIQTGIIGAFGENLELENYVVINENIKNLILTKNVKLDLNKISNFQQVSINDFIEIDTSTIVLPPNIEERIDFLESLILEGL